MTLTYRLASPADALVLTELYLMAGGGLMEYLFDGLIERDVIGTTISNVVTDPASELSYLNTYVALDGDTIVAGCNSYSSEKHCVSPEMRAFLPPERLALVEGIFTTRQDNSLYINALSVFPDYRGRGVAKALLAKMLVRAKDEGYGSVSLIVWADNLEATGLYEKYGFKYVQHINIPWHEKLSHQGGCSLMVLKVT